MKLPTEVDAAKIAQNMLAQSIARTRRMITGAGNWVYEVTTDDGTEAIVRIARCNRECAAGVYWSQRLRPMGVPLPKMVAHSLGSADERAWMMLERLPGADLEHVYASLTTAQKLCVLDGVMGAQTVVQSLPRGGGFGYVCMPDAAPHATWRDVILWDLKRSRQRIAALGLIDVQHIDRIVRLVGRFENYFPSIPPVPFLDDTTTRNVIVHNGKLSGIVDVDGICYGDPLTTVALTRMALLSRGCDTIYTDAWLDRLEATPQQRRAVDFYTACYCGNFLSEQGQQFNRDAPPLVDAAEVQRLLDILDAVVDA